MSQPNSFYDLVHSRRSVRKYDQETTFDHTAVDRALDLTLLSPNSSNMQLWEFHRVISEDKRKQLAKICMNQNAARTANEMVVFVTTASKWEQRAKMNAKQIRDNFANRPFDETAKRATKYYEKLMPFVYDQDRFGIKGYFKKLMVTFMGLKKPMFREVSKQDVRVCLHKSASLAAMTFMTAIRDEGYDTCPMEGFDSLRAKKLLGLRADDEITMIISVGKRTEAGIYGERHRVPAEEVIFKH